MSTNVNCNTYDDISGIPSAQSAMQYKKSLMEGWQDFLKGKEPLSIRPSVLASWKRSREAKVDPYVFNYTYPEQTVLEEILNKNKDLISVGKNIMENLLAFNPDGHINLSSAEGVTLYFCGLDLTPVGAILTEDVLGTNSTARCLLENRLVYTASYENWKFALRERNQHCAAAPIRQSDGSLIGVLTLTGTKGEFNHHTLGTVKAAAEAIEQQLILKQLVLEQKSILETLNEGVIVADSTGLIKTASRYAKQVLRVTELVGQHIDDALNPEDCSFITMLPCNDQEIVFWNKSGERFPCIISLMKLKSGGVVLSFRENKHIRAISRKLLGSGASYTFEKIIGQSDPLLKTLERAKNCSRTDSTVLVTGESGTGKELFAQAIHNSSSRNQGPFIAINCGAIPRDLVQSELFGYVDGAYTGARSGGSPGKFELADGGTLFLDEIGEMPLEAQTSLLRVLQENEVMRIGSVKPYKLNVRVIAATNCDLKIMVDNASFRRDLYYRLNVLSITIPPLRERGDDIVKLIDFFSHRTCQNLKRIVPEFTTDALEMLTRYSWPGNVRELENIVERIINLNPGLTIDNQHLPDEIYVSQPQEKLPTSTQHSAFHKAGYDINNIDLTPKDKLLANQERNLVVELLKSNNGNIQKTSQELGISRPSLYNKLKRWQIDIKNFR